jgi:hypothetical protein
MPNSVSEFNALPYLADLVNARIEADNPHHGYMWLWKNHCRQRTF